MSYTSKVTELEHTIITQWRTESKIVHKNYWYTTKYYHDIEMSSLQPPVVRSAGTP